MDNLSNGLKQGRIYVIESRESIFICCFDRLEDFPEMGQKVIKDFFCLATKKDSTYTMKFMCDNTPLTLELISIREATDEEIGIFFTIVRAEILKIETKKG